MRLAQFSQRFEIAVLALWPKLRTELCNGGNPVSKPLRSLAAVSLQLAKERLACNIAGIHAPHPDWPPAMHADFVAFPDDRALWKCGLIVFCWLSHRACWSFRLCGGLSLSDEFAVRLWVWELSLMRYMPQM